MQVLTHCSQGMYTGTQQHVPVVPFVEANNEHFQFDADTMEDLNQMHETCGFKALIDKYLTYPPPGNQPRFKRQSGCSIFDRVQYESMSSNSCFNVYQIAQKCPTPTDVMKGRMPYFNRPDVKTALHAPQSVTWAECSRKRVFLGGLGGPEMEGDLSADPIEKVLPQVVQATNRVLVANGNYDM